MACHSRTVRGPGPEEGPAFMLSALLRGDAWCLGRCPGSLGVRVSSRMWSCCGGPSGPLVSGGALCGVSSVPVTGSDRCRGRFRLVVVSMPSGSGRARFSTARSTRGVPCRLMMSPTARSGCRVRETLLGVAGNFRSLRWGVVLERAVGFPAVVPAGVVVGGGGSVPAGGLLPVFRAGGPVPCRSARECSRVCSLRGQGAGRFVG